MQTVPPCPECLKQKTEKKPTKKHNKNDSDDDDDSDDYAPRGTSIIKPVRNIIMVMIIIIMYKRIQMILYAFF